MSDESGAKPKKLSGHGKKYSDAQAKVDKDKKYSVEEGFKLLTDVAYAKFDETVDVAFNLGVDPKHADQMVRGAVVLPHGTGQSQRIAVVAKGERAKDAEAAGADHVGAEDLVEKIQGGWLEFDKLIATPDMMVAISKVGRVLGPKGLMPNPKLGTVTMDVKKAVEDQKKGKVEFGTKKIGIIHTRVGKKSMGADKLRENFNTISNVILKAKPPTSKGTYLQRVTISTSMGPGITLDTSSVQQSAN